MKTIDVKTFFKFFLKTNVSFNFSNIYKDNQIQNNYNFMQYVFFKRGICSVQLGLEQRLFAPKDGEFFENFCVKNNLTILQNTYIATIMQFSLAVPALHKSIRKSLSKYFVLKVTLQFYERLKKYLSISMCHHGKNNFILCPLEHNLYIAQRMCQHLYQPLLLSLDLQGP